MPRLLLASLLLIGTSAWGAEPLASSDDWSREHAAHLLRRAGFGGSQEQIAFVASLGKKKAVDYLVDYESLPDVPLAIRLDPPPPPIRVAHPDADREQLQKLRNRLRQADRVLLRQIANAWLAKMVSTSRPLQEKMVLFWHGHFTSGHREVRSARAMYTQNELFRANAKAKFRDLLISIGEDPAMILYLNTQQNVRRKPNENYARELMELFTMGVGEYTETDIKEAARAFTGVKTDRRTCDVRYVGRQHDFGKKTFLGRTGDFDPADIIDIILKQPVTAEYIAAKLWCFFAYEEPDDELVKALAKAFRDGDYDVGNLLRTMFMSDAFYSERARFTHIKSPVELLVGTLRSLEIAAVDTNTMNNQLRAMGQQLFQPPNVKGWDGGAAWINTSTLFNRYNALSHALFGNDNRQYRQRARRRLEQLRRTLGKEAEGMMMAMDGSDAIRPQPAYDPMPVVRSLKKKTPEAIVDHYVKRLLQRRIDRKSRASLIEALKQVIDTRDIENPRNARGIRTLIHLIVSMPEYQLS